MVAIFKSCHRSGFTGVYGFINVTAVTKLFVPYKTVASQWSSSSIKHTQENLANTLSMDYPPEEHDHVRIYSEGLHNGIKQGDGAGQVHIPACPGYPPEMSAFG